MSQLVELPHNKEAETSVLGAILVDNALLERVRLRPEHFYLPAHVRIFRAMLALQKERKPIDVLTVAELLEHDQVVEDAGGVTYLSRLMDGIPRLVNVEHYAGIVLERAMRRAVVSLCHSLADDAAFGDSDVASILNRGETRLKEITRGLAGEKLETLAQGLGLVLDAIEERERKGAGITGVPTGFGVLDRMTDGLQKGDLIVLAGRPSMGKSSIAMNIAVNAALEGKSVAIISLEMSRASLLKRLAFAEAKVNAEKSKLGQLTDRDWFKLEHAFRRLKDAKLWIDDSTGMTVARMRSKLTKLRADVGLDLVVVDYVGLVKPEGSRENRAQEVAGISTDLKAMARDLDVPVVALAQLNRECEKRQDKRPQLSDLKDSGRLEEDADIVLLLYREEYYMERERVPIPQDKLGLAELIVAKARNGPTGTVLMHFDKTVTRFDEPERKHGEDHGRQHLPFSTAA